MSNVKSSRIDLLYAFIEQIVAIPKLWFGDQRLTLERVFPDFLFSMFREWYDRFEGLDIDSDFDELFQDLEVFIQNFEKVFSEYKLKLVHKESKSPSNLSRYPYKYNLSIRLSKLGLELYSHVLPGEDALEDIDKYLNRQALAKKR